MLQNLKTRLKKFNDEYHIDTPSAVLGVGAGVLAAGSVMAIKKIVTPMTKVGMIYVDVDPGIEEKIKSITTFMSNGVVQTWTKTDK